MFLINLYHILHTAGSLSDILWNLKEALMRNIINDNQKIKWNRCKYSNIKSLFLPIQKNYLGNLDRIEIDKKTLFLDNVKYMNE